MIPIKDDNPTTTYPFITILLIALNVLVHFYKMLLPAADAEAFLFHYGAIPAIISQGQNLLSPFTSMFLHGDLLHLGGNMLYLWIFGDNIEHISGHFKFLVFYLLCGFIAFFSHFVLDLSSTVPMVGASGAISGILGAYVLRFPKARVYVLFWFFFIFVRLIPVPAFIVLGLWFLINIWNSLMVPASMGGVAWFAHIGGFIAGMLFIRAFEKKKYKIRYF